MAENQASSNIEMTICYFENAGYTDPVSCLACYYRQNAVLSHSNCTRLDATMHKVLPARAAGSRGQVW